MQGTVIELKKAFHVKKSYDVQYDRWMFIAWLGRLEDDDCKTGWQLDPRDLRIEDHLIARAEAYLRNPNYPESS